MDLTAAISKLRITFRFKLFSIFTLLTALITSLCTALYISTEIKAQRLAYKEKAQMLATNLAESARLPLYAENREALMLLVNAALRHPEVYSAAFSSTDGRLLASLNKGNKTAHASLISKTVEVFSAPLGESAETAFTSNNIKTPVLIGSVILQLDSSKLTKLVRSIVIKSFSIAFTFWLMVAILAYAGLRKATHSFNTLINGIETMRAGNFTSRIKVDSDDEPSRAALAINELAATLQKRDQENARLQEELVNALRLEVQEEKKQLMAKLIQTNRMTSLGLLASSMAHEINNPNGSIRLANHYLSRACKDALPLLQQIATEEGDFSLGGIPFSTARKTLAECGETIERSTYRIAQVIQDLRSYSLGERNDFHKDVDINQVVSGALTIVRSHGKYSGMTLLSDSASDIPLITGSHHQLEQVLINLLLNAIQATPGGKGVVTVYSCLDRASNQVRVSVRDEGAGIPPEDMKHLLEPFFSTRIEQGGSGLGLFVTNFIIKAHNGTLKFSSEPGAGTTVIIHLPVSQDSAPA